nr:hypothetical protein [uncultured Dorea sp.]
MKRKSILYKDLEVSRAKEIYDESCKNILANKIILAWIMKSCMKEYKDSSICDIADHYIEGTPEISQREVHRDEVPASDPGKIRGENTEDKAVNEGTVRYDIMFRAILPQGQERIELIINIEAQKDFYPGYPLIKRGIYYGCRMISSQYGTIFTNSHYEKIQKVYSIWICFNPPEKRKNSINIYSVKEKNVVGKVKEKEADYDLLTAVMICLDSGKEEKEGKHQEGTEESEILRLLEVLFSTEKELKEKEKILENEYGITMTYEEKEEVEKMCNLSEYVWEKGLQTGREEGLRTGINYGELQNLVRMVLKKMRKDVSYEITAELFEEPAEKIRKIYEVAEKYAPEYDIELICRELAA